MTVGQWLRLWAALSDTWPIWRQWAVRANLHVGSALLAEFSVSKGKVQLLQESAPSQLLQNSPGRFFRIGKK
jgi:hypothetical protein